MRGINSYVGYARNVHNVYKILYIKRSSQNIPNNIFLVELHIIFDRGLMPLEPINLSKKGSFQSHEAA